MKRKSYWGKTTVSGRAVTAWVEESFRWTLIKRSQKLSLQTNISIRVLKSIKSSWQFYTIALIIFLLETKNALRVHGRIFKGIGILRTEVF